MRSLLSVVVALYLASPGAASCATETALLLADEALQEQQLRLVGFVSEPGAVECSSSSSAEGGIATACVNDYSPLGPSFREACEGPAGGTYQEASWRTACGWTGSGGGGNTSTTSDTLHLPGCLGMSCPDGYHQSNQLSHAEIVARTIEKGISEQFGPGYTCHVSAIHDADKGVIVTDDATETPPPTNAPVEEPDPNGENGDTADATMDPDTATGDGGTVTPPPTTAPVEEPDPNGENGDAAVAMMDPDPAPGDGGTVDRERGSNSSLSSACSLQEGRTTTTAVFLSALLVAMATSASGRFGA